MKAQIEVADIAYETLYEQIVAQLPSLTPEQRAEKAKELGQEPLCQENVNNRIFMLGMRMFVDKEVPLLSAVKKANEMSLHTKVARVLVDIYTTASAKCEVAKTEYGVESPEYLIAHKFLDIVSQVVAHIDAEVTGDDSLKKAVFKKPSNHTPKRKGKR